MSITRERLARLSATLAITFASVAAPVGRAEAQPSRGALARGSFAITNVSVVPMTSETVLSDATVLVRDGRIAEVGPSQSVRAPAGTRTIDGRGKFVIPGLADMHVHLFSDEENLGPVGGDELAVMVAN